MKLLKFYDSKNTLKLRIDTLDDLWTVQRIIFADDMVKAESLRKFKANEKDTGERKDVTIILKVEKTELDKTAMMLRILGTIVDGRPLEYVKLNSHHSLGVAPGDTIEITKTEWKDYMIKMLKNAVSDTKKARLGVIAVDEEKALPALLLGYGIEFKNEIYSRLSKRMSQKEFVEQEKKYFQSILDLASEMKCENVIIAGPGFTKEDVKAFGEQSGFMKKLSGKRLIFESISNTERSGIYELIKSEKVEELLHRERIRQEFQLMEEFLTGISTGKSKYGKKNVFEAIETYEARAVLVNDSMIGDAEMQKLLDRAEKNRIKIEVFNSDDEVGRQLNGFGGIACF
jgi:protein pelota